MRWRRKESISLRWWQDCWDVQGDVPTGFRFAGETFVRSMMENPAVVDEWWSKSFVRWSRKASPFARWDRKRTTRWRQNEFGRKETSDLRKEKRRDSLQHEEREELHWMTVLHPDSFLNQHRFLSIRKISEWIFWHWDLHVLSDYRWSTNLKQRLYQTFFVFFFVFTAQCSSIKSMGDISSAVQGWLPNKKQPYVAIRWRIHLCGDG